LICRRLDVLPDFPLKKSGKDNFYLCDPAGSSDPAFAGEGARTQTEPTYLLSKAWTFSLAELLTD